MLLRLNESPPRPTFHSTSCQWAAITIVHNHRAYDGTCRLSQTSHFLRFYAVMYHLVLRFGETHTEQEVRDETFSSSLSSAETKLLRGMFERHSVTGVRLREHDRASNFILKKFYFLTLGTLGNASPLLWFSLLLVCPLSFAEKPFCKHIMNSKSNTMWVNHTAF